MRGLEKKITNCLLINLLVAGVIFSHGGVLPWAKDPQSGRSMVLLGQRSYGSQIGTWTDFGGLADPGETVAQTAVRECDEETMGLLDGPDNIADRLKEKLSMVSPTPRRYRMYLVPVYYRDAQIFNQAKQDLENEYGPDFDDLHVEPSNYTWVYADDLDNVVSNKKRRRMLHDANGNSIELFSSFANNLKTDEGRHVIEGIVKEENDRSLQDVISEQYANLQNVSQLTIEQALEEFRSRARYRGVIRPTRRLQQLKRRAQKYRVLRQKREKSEL